MRKRPESSDVTTKSEQVEQSRGRIRVDQHVEAIEIDLSRPRLILVEGMTRRGNLVQRHLKITEKEKLVMV